MSDPIELLERRVKAVVTGEQSSTGLHFFCQIGGRYDDRGITTLQISGSGWALLSWRVRDETDMYNYQLSHDDVKKFYAMLLEYPFWSTSPRRRTRDEGEVNVHLRLSDQSKGTYSGVQFWTRDVEEFPLLTDLMDRINTLIDMLSDSEIPLIKF